MTTPKGMLFKFIEVEDFDRFAGDDRWVAEQKLDGVRCLTTTSHPAFHSRNGETLKHAASCLNLAPIIPDLTSIGNVFGDCILDGELLADGNYWVYDVLRVLGDDTTKRTQVERREVLEFVMASVECNHIKIVPQAKTVEDKMALFANLQEAGAEGLMLKCKTGLYHPGKRTADGLKVKFVKTADVIVTGRNTEESRHSIKGGTKENAELAVYGPNGRLIDLGSCSMIGKPNVNVGDVIEVKYLYLGDQGRLYQPRFMGVRSDKPATACTFDQFVPTNRDVLVS